MTREMSAPAHIHTSKTTAERAAAVADVEAARMNEPTPAAFLDAQSFHRFDETVLAVHAELRLDVALRRIVELARDLVGARYAALGIVGADGCLTDFITAGLTDAARAEIGPLPRGHGILGVLIREQRSLRLPDLGADPRSSGFPPDHPPMTSFLGVPIRLGEEAIGNFYLTEKQGAAAFSVEDQRLVERLAQHAAVAVQNARRYAETEVQRQLLRAMVEHMPEAVTIREAPGGQQPGARVARERHLGCGRDRGDHCDFPPDAPIGAAVRAGGDADDAGADDGRRGRGRGDCRP